MGQQQFEIADHDSDPLRKQYTLFLGTMSQFCYVGAQAAVATCFINFCLEAGKDKAALRTFSLRLRVSMPQTVLLQVGL